MIEPTPLTTPAGLTRVFSDVYVVTGGGRPRWRGEPWHHPRTMTVVCDEHDDITLINAARLDEGALASLEGLGTIKHVLQLGHFHGQDDGFYVDRYGAKHWSLPGIDEEASGHQATIELRPGGPMPFHGASLFVFESARHPEGILLIDRDEGILIACDSLQSWSDPGRYLSPEVVAAMGERGLLRPASVSPEWQEACAPNVADFHRLLDLPFHHLVCAHGEPLRDLAHERLSATVRDLDGDAPAHAGPRPAEVTARGA